MIRSYFTDIGIRFAKLIKKSKNVYFIHTNVDNGKMLNISMHF